MLAVGQLLLLVGNWQNRKYWLGLLAIDVLVLLIVAINLWMGHLSAIERVCEPLLFCALIATCFLYPSVQKHVSTLFGWHQILCVLIPILIFGGMKIYGQQLSALPVINYFYGQTVNSPRTALRADYMEKIDQDHSHVYFTPLGSYVWWNFGFSIFERPYADFCPNLFALGGWDARAPYNTRRLAEYGIKNPLRALFEDEDVYAFYSPNILPYLQEHYSSHIQMSQIKTIGELLGAASVVQYSGTIQETLCQEGFGLQAHADAFSYTLLDNVDAWTLHGTLQGKTQDISALYCNLTKDGERVTYRLNLDEKGTFYGGFYGLQEDFQANDADLVLIAKTTEGKFLTVVLS